LSLITFNESFWLGFKPWQDNFMFYVAGAIVRSAASYRVDVDE
jgi:hypothetical protein